MKPSINPEPEPKAKPGSKGTPDGFLTPGAPSVPHTRKSDEDAPVFKHRPDAAEMRVLEESIEANLKKITPHDATMPLDEFKGVFRSDQSPSPEPRRLNPSFFRADLPIDDCRKELMKIIKGSQVTIISGTTG